MTNTTGFLGHPKGLTTLFFTEMWERMSYYGMRAILILFMTTEVAKEGLGLDTATAGAVYGLYTASVYLLSLPGGWIADNIIGQRKAIWYGGILIMIGHVILAIPGDPIVFFSGLAFVAFGTGFLKPNISSIVGDLYPEGGARRDAGFSIFYMGINLGSFLGYLIIPYLGEKIDWHLGFGVAAIGMLIGLIQYKLTEKNLGQIGIVPKAKEVSNKSNPLATIGIVGIFAVSIFLLQYFGIIDLTSAVGVARATGILIVAITLTYFAYILIAGGLTSIEKKRVGIIFLLFIGAAMFWSGFEQAGSSLNLFARDYTDRVIFGWEMPTGWLQTVNPLMIILFAPLVGALWVKLAARNLNPSIPLKFAFGLLLLAAGFMIMVFAARIVTEGGKAGMFWLVVTYFLHSIGELTLSPVGLSATTKLAPKKYYGQMMGIWFVATALGNLFAGLFAGNFNPENVQEMPNLFLSIVSISAGAGIVFILISPFTKKWIGDIK
jgi:POT family proton-dependent oligopeptide transporter